MLLWKEKPVAQSGWDEHPFVPVKPMIHGPICRIRHVGYDKICGCLIVYHPIKHHATPSDNVVRLENRTCSIFIRLQPTLSNGQTNQMTGICPRGYVYVFVCMSTC